MTKEIERKMLELAGEMSAICETVPNCEECPFYVGEDKLTEQGSCCKLQIYFPSIWKGVVLEIIDEKIKSTRKEIHEKYKSSSDVK